MKGFTSRYNVGKLVWWEDFDDIQLTIPSEKTMKKWPRQRKINTIDSENREWKDLSLMLFSTST